MDSPWEKLGFMWVYMNFYVKVDILASAVLAFRKPDGWMDG